MKITLITLSAVAMLASAGFVTQASAQILLNSTGTPYTENFDIMGATGTTTPNGFFVGTGTGSAVTGTTVTPGTGSSTAGGNYNFGVMGTNAVTDRALGSLSSGSLQRDTEARLSNNTGDLIGSLSISYTGEQWRAGGSTAVANTLTLQYSADGLTFAALGSGFNFVSPVNPTTAGALDGNAAANRTTGIGGTYTPLAPIAAGATFYLRWADPDDAGSDHGLAIDDFSVTALPVPEPSTYAMMAGAFGLLLVGQRIRRTARA